ncbi:lipopolysaccharide biosynthesis protein, partial [Saccharopolyspora mangrovi]|uniref:lipopolysaccharide biosynthesis protein n=1 Tax=Saccharopolyspora mangrovi TaxID=3082379 RepID=UPI002B4C1359
MASLVSVPVLYDQLGERSYGVWALLTGLVAAGALVDMGLGAVQVREVALAAAGGDRRHARAVLALGLVIGAGLGVLAIAITAVCWPVLASMFDLRSVADQARGAVLLMLVGFLLDSMAMPWRAMLEGNQHYGPVGLIAGGTGILGAALVVLAALFGDGLEWLGASVAVTSMVRAALLVTIARRRVPALTPRIRSVGWFDLTTAASYGIRVQASNSGAVVNNQTDRLVLAAFFDLHTVAGFDLGSRLVNPLRMLPSFVLTALFPVATTMAGDGARQRLDRLYLVLTGYLAAFGGIGAAALVVSADPLVRLWLGQPVPAAATTIMVLAPGLAVTMAASAAAIVTRAEGYPGRETRCTVLAALLNVALTLPLMLVVGPHGVPLATTLALSLITAYFFVYFHRSSGRPLAPLLRVLWPPALAAIVAGVFTWLLQPALPDGPGRVAAGLAVLCRGGLTFVVAAIVLAALGFFDMSSRNWLRLGTARPASGVRTADVQEEAQLRNHCEGIRCLLCKQMSGNEPVLEGILRRCLSCGFVWTTENCDDASATDIYNDSYFREGGYRNYFGEDAQRRYEAGRRLRWLLSATRPRSIVEAGSAGGFFLEQARRAGIQV